MTLKEALERSPIGRADNYFLGMTNLNEYNLVLGISYHKRHPSTLGRLDWEPSLDEGYQFRAQTEYKLILARKYLRSQNIL